MGRRAPDREDGKETPASYAILDEELLEEIQVADVVLVHAGDDIPCHFRIAAQQADRVEGSLKAPGVPAQPVVSLLEAVEADRRRVHASRHQFLQA